MRKAFQGKHAFNGLKNIALLRMLHKAQNHGPTIAVVLPVSPSYAKEFLTPDVRQEFERELSDAEQSEPHVHWVRLDLMNELRLDEYFSDLVHMNLYGRQIATDAFLSQLRSFKER
jgi:hypothetical protein